MVKRDPVGVTPKVFASGEVRSYPGRSASIRSRRDHVSASPSQQPTNLKVNRYHPLLEGEAGMVVRDPPEGLDKVTENPVASGGSGLYHSQ